MFRFRCVRLPFTVMRQIEVIGWHLGHAMSRDQGQSSSEAVGCCLGLSAPPPEPLHGRPSTDSPKAT